MTIVPVTGQCQSALKLVVIIPHALNKRSKEMSRARETLLRSQHGLETIGKGFSFCLVLQKLICNHSICLWYIFYRTD